MSQGERTGTSPLLDPLLFAALDVTSDAVLVRDLEGVVIYWNPVASARLGFSREEAVGRLWHELLQTRSEEPLSELEGTVRETGRWSGFLTHRHAGGADIRVGSTWVLLRDGEGAAVGVIQLNNEVERLETALRELRHMEETQRAILDNSPVATILFRPDYSLLHANLSAQRMFGRDPAGFGTHGLLSVIPERERHKAADLAAQRDATGAGHAELDLQHADGTTFPAEVSSAIIAGPGGAPAIINYITDLTQRRRLERELRAGGELQRAVLSSSADAVMLWGIEPASGRPRLLDANQAACDLFECTLATLRATGVEVLADPSGPSFRALIGQLAETGKASGELLLKNLAGVPFVADVGMSSFRGPDGQPYSSVIIRDLTDRRRAARALEESERRFRAIFNRAPLAIARVGIDLRIIESNLRLRQLLSAGADLSGRPVTDFLTPEDFNDVAERFREMIRTRAEVTQADTNAIRDDGTTVWLHWTATVFRREDGDLDQFLVLLEDVSARKAAEDSIARNLQELERISTLKSEFVGLVSHEFRTALTGIQGFSELIRDAPLDPAEMREFAGDINKDALRLNRMITEMLDLDRMEAGRFSINATDLDLRELIEESVERAGPLSEIHEVSASIEADLPRVEADHDRVVQVLSNLISNAIKYSPAGGRVEVRAAAMRNVVQVSVSDQGEGIPDDFLPKVFERFERYESTATSRVIGTGLGLPIARQIVEAHGGRMWVESRMGVGSTFYFTLPVLTAGKSPAGVLR